MYQDREESDASFIALQSDQLFDDVQASALQRKRRRTLPQSSSDNDNGKCNIKGIVNMLL